MKKLASLLSIFLITYYKLRFGKRVQFGRNVLINHRFKVAGSGRLIIEDNCKLWAHEEPNRFFLYSKDAVIRVGKGSKLNGVTCHSESSITFGEHCLVGSATLMDTDFHTFDDPTHILYGNSKTKPISIGSGAWLGGQCAILKGVSLGANSVVGFRSVVTKSFPAHVVVGGNPATIIKQRREDI